MKKHIALSLLVAVFLAGCNNDGVPEVKDFHHPTDADGNPMKASDFLQKYCVAKIGNETCERVRITAGMDSSKGPMPKGW